VNLDIESLCLDWVMPGSPDFDFSICFAVIEFRQILGYGKDARLTIEVDPVSRVDRKLDLAGFRAKPGDLISHGYPLPQLLCYENYLPMRLFPRG
jgi:hypothetical protein